MNILIVPATLECAPPGSEVSLISFGLRGRRPQNRPSAFTANVQLEKLERKSLATGEYEDEKDVPFPQSLQAPNRYFVGPCLCCLRPHNPDEEGRISDLIWFAVLVMFIASQLFWIRCMVDVGKRFLPGKLRRARLEAIAGAICVMLFLYNLLTWDSLTWNSRHASTGLTLRAVLLEAPFWWWFVGSFAGFFLVLAFWTLDRAARAGVWVYRTMHNATSARDALKTEERVSLPASPSRRQFLERAAVLASATPFVAAGSGLLRGRLDVEVTRQRTDCHACLRPSKDSALSSFPIFTSALSRPRSRFVVARRLPTD
jgi:hypothetical protein